jgi:hypothetical protein
MNNDWGKGLCGSGGVMERRMISGRRFAFGMATGNLFLKGLEEMFSNVPFGADVIKGYHVFLFPPQSYKLTLGLV